MANDGVAVRSCPRGTKQQPHRPAALRQWRGKRSRLPTTVPSCRCSLLPAGTTRGGGDRCQGGRAIIGAIRRKNLAPEILGRPELQRGRVQVAVLFLRLI